MFASFNSKPKPIRQKQPPLPSKIMGFQRDEDGGLLILSLFMLIIMLMVTGLAVDLIRVETNRSRLQATLDRAVLAGASLQQTLDSETVVQDYFNKAGFGGTISANNINAVAGSNGKLVAASAGMNVNSIFLNLLGISSLNSVANGTAEESQTEIEISLVVDTSGSMGGTSASGNSKIDDLKVAAKEFVYLMQCDPDASPPFDGNCTTDPDTVSISLVPYNEQVLLGETLIQQFNTTEEHAQSSCIDFDTADYSTTGVELDPLLLGGLADPTPNLRRSATIDPWSWGDTASDWRRSCSANAQRAVLPFENLYQDLNVAIDGLYASGYTSIELGMKWGAALLDPSFRPAVDNMAANLGVLTPNFIGRPAVYSDASVKKVVVLMTDGKNTTQHKVRPGFRAGPSPFFVNNSGGPEDGNVSVYDAVNDVYYWEDDDSYHTTPDGDASAVNLSYPEFWENYSWSFYRSVESEANLPNAVDQIFNGEKDVNLDAMCDAAKAQGIVIFTMGFETSTASSQVMQACASTPSHHYDVTGLDIGLAFHSIARNIKALRLIN